MQYHGGKARLAKHIVDAMTPDLERCRLYVEPFVGAGSVLVEVKKRFPKLKCLAADIALDLILMWIALQDGWLPPTNLSYEEYQQLRYDTEASPLRAFAGFACSFGGRYFEGYARSGDTNFAEVGRRSLIEKAKHIKDVAFVQSAYNSLSIPERSLIYCDPPYAGSKPYSRMPAWNARSFWNHACFWKQGGNSIYVSEFSAPSFVKCRVAFEVNRPVTAGLHKGKNAKPKKIDRLYEIIS